MSTDHRLNSAVYGADVSPSAILDGRVEPPTAFEALYAMLESLAARHQSPFARSANPVGATTRDGPSLLTALGGEAAGILCCGKSPV